MPSKELECRDAEIGYRVHALDHCAPFRSAQLPSFRAKIIFDLQLADLPVQNIDLGFVDGSLRRSPVLEDAGHTVEQLLLPVVDMVWMDPKNSLANSAKVRSPLIAALPSPCTPRCASSVSASCPAPAPPVFSRGRAPAYPPVSFSGSSSDLRQKDSFLTRAAR